MDEKEIKIDCKKLIDEFEYYIIADQELNIIELSDLFDCDLDKYRDLKLNQIIKQTEDDLLISNFENPQSIEPFTGHFLDKEGIIFLKGIYLQNSGVNFLLANSIQPASKYSIRDNFLLESRLFKSFLDNVGASVYYKDVNGKFIKINKSMADSIGLKNPDEAIGKTDSDFFSKKLASETLKDEKYILETGNSILNKVEQEVWQDGNISWVLTNKFPVRSEENEIIGLFGISRDITEEKKREDIHKYEQYLFNMLMQNISDSIYFKDLECRFIKVSDSMLAKHGFKDNNEIKGLTDFDLYTEEHASQAYTDEQQILSNGYPINNFVEKETHRDGSEVWLSTSKMPLYDKGKIIGTFGISRDITPIKIQERTQAVLYKLSEAANAIDNLEELFENIYLIISELLPTKNFYIAQYSSSKNIISFPYWKDELDSAPEPGIHENSITRYVINVADSLLLSKSNIEEKINDHNFECKGKVPAYWLGIPLKIQDNVLGIIAIKSYDESQKINDFHQKILTFVSTQVAAVIERVRAKEKLLAEIKEREELSESLKKSNEIINNSQAVVFRWINDSNWSVEFVSNNVEAILGYSADEFLNGTIRFTEIIHRDDLNRVTEELTNCLFDKTINYFTHSSYRINKKDGEVLWMENRTFILRDDEGNITYYEGILIDVTERKINEEKARFRSEFEKRIAQISSYFVEQELSNINDALSFASQHIGSFLGAERTYVALSGNEKNKFHISFEHSNREIDSLLIDDNCNLIFNEDMSLKLHDGMVIFLPRVGANLDFDLNDKFNQYNNVISFIAIPIYVDKALQGFLGYDFFSQPTNLQFEDLHILELFSEIISNVYKNYLIEIEQKKLRLLMEKMTQAVEQSANSIVITNIDGDIEYVNPKFEDVTGYSFAEIKGKNSRVLKSGATSDEEYHEMWSVLKQGESWHGEFKNKRKNGDFFWERVTISSIKNSEGTITSFLAVKEDITERILVENQLALSQKMESIGQLAAGIAHEINTPMQYVGDNANFFNDAFGALFKVFYDFNAFLEDGNNYSTIDIRNFYQGKKEEMDLEFIFEEVPQALEQTKIGISHVTKIIKAMKNFAHPGTKDKSPHDINRGIENTATISRNEWKYVAELKLDLDENIGEVECLLDELNQVFLNMIVNSAHSIEEKLAATKSSELGEIKITTQKLNDNVIITIADTGKGIKKEIIRRIFDPFFTTKEVGKGTGQGLAIVHDIIVNKHSGKIDVESEEGKGAKFKISIPISSNRKDQQ